MAIDMNDKQLLTLAQLQAFLEGTVAVDAALAAEERYDFIARTLSRFGYRCLWRAAKAGVLRFLEREWAIMFPIPSRDSAQAHATGATFYTHGEK